ncbi:S-methyl-5-thioribose-1-phosphate isomerase [Paraliomyxa miuraensis]|uniref:S-methyl-5-thioribose-1-phosphate isomerase n=1 Tax=Paraliomyxa miuraensis TaxID=376150 RepID=UPI00224DE497|nr:S-methyl-5-thioribose-1-phosphate isomerase [Paraliomyxa miuraensis]MCX4246262.1 S-methyl-5-thioribose-1-phosphate isomerase [Paraliomyxa miuraensis]
MTNGPSPSPVTPDDPKAVGLRPLMLSEDGLVLRMLDQRALPERELWLELRDVEAVARAIEDLAVRGAPAIGCAAALGLAAAAHAFGDDPQQVRARIEQGCERLSRTRPTAVNLFVALDQIREAIAATPSDADASRLREVLRRTAQQHTDDDLASCLAMGEHGARLLPEGGTILTHCNTGALATAGYGTALGVIRRAHTLGRGIRVLADETRPVLQGARLTVWELMRDGIPVELITDNMAGALMARGQVQAAIVGADRIARNGDVANKIGTYSVAVLCKHHGLPFYVAAPWTTIDLSIASGAEIPIEERHPDEVRRLGGCSTAPADAPVRNPAFDVTPASLITAIITERGVLPPHALADAAASGG